MKIWKMVGCLALLAVIICGCVILAQNAEVAAQSTDEEQQQGTDLQDEQANEQDGADAKQQGAQGSASVGKVYSEGLAFRSNGDGTCALSGLGSCTAACILIPPTSPSGDTVTEILPYAFANGIVTAVELPTTVTKLSDAAFGDCSRLSCVRVAQGNAAFLEYDGVLYTADGSTLLYCPADRTATDLRLHSSLRRIAAGAFRDCRTLAVVYFKGTTSEWHAIIIGDENEALYGASFRFNAQ